MNKALVQSYLRNLVGQIFGAIMIVMQTSGLGSPIEFSTSEWILVANALWASLIPVVLRFLNTSDPAFGLVVREVAIEVSKQLTKAADEAKKPAVKKPVAKKPTTPVAKKPTPKK